MSILFAIVRGGCGWSSDTTEEVKGDTFMSYPILVHRSDLIMKVMVMPEGDGEDASLPLVP